MRFSILMTGIFAAATLLLATPTHSADLTHNLAHGLAGNVLDSNGKAYMLKATEPGNVKIITDRINGEWMRPASFVVEQDYFCKFYQESTRGIGSLIGGFNGPLFQVFGKNDWAAFYECYESTQTSLNVTTRSLTMIPCGSVQLADGNRASLNEGHQGRMSDFTINGELYTPISYHVSSGCKCRFYRYVRYSWAHMEHGWDPFKYPEDFLANLNSARTVRGGAEMIAASEGPSDGQFGMPAAARYQCWLRT